MRSVAWKDVVPLGPKGPIGVVVDPATWRAAPYLLLSLVFGLGWGAVLGVAVPFSLMLVAVWVGVPLVLATMWLWRGAAMLERRVLGAALGVRIRDPYRERPDHGVVQYVAWLVKDPATWKDLGYLLLLLPLGAVEFVASAVLWGSTLALLTAPFGVEWEVRLELWGGLLTFDDQVDAAFGAMLGLVMLPASGYAVRGMAFLHGTLAKALLGGSEEERLRASRARGIDAAEAERRRIERDLHDGAQQRLLSVAVDLGRAQAKLDSDPEEVRALIAQAHAGTKAAIKELRDLARGIYPAILTDRGLDAALSGLAARAPIRVDVSVDLAERPPAAVESIAYFIVAEALTNMAKHAAATEASVTVSRDGRRVLVDVWDDGIGGASVTPGGGLAGLADRAATIDGVLVLHSPVGGPTLVRAELPCEW
ncbi:sensor histidine kinase [Nonomuraea pusilla]|uniref:histidine kinase n=1 Tax=Nonomuraea pusilla TaxID=46177 RepID=A0A1H7WH42_9ACTN|nr:sensor histidine kinase [Nonomuraea pusilla]SEM20664.1 Signal transduction histidine kinase [Nonomuraea pusilla]